MRRKRTTRPQLDAFKQEFLVWRDRFGLCEYEVDFEVADIDGSFAEISVDAENFIASVFWCKYAPPKNNVNIEVARATAKHEAIHLLLARFAHEARRRFTSEDALYHEEERIVRILEDIL